MRLDHRSCALLQPIGLLLTDLSLVLGLLLRHECIIAGKVPSQIRIRGVVLCSETLHFICMVILLG